MELKYAAILPDPHGKLRDAPKNMIITLVPDSQPVPFLVVGLTSGYATLLNLKTGYTSVWRLDTKYWELRAQLVIEGIKG